MRAPGFAMLLALPFILFGALLAAIPLLVHLLHRQKATPVQWGAMQFLLESPIRQRRRKRVDHWLLMLVRMAVLALLALLLARPIILESRYNPFAANTAADIAVVIDHSLSMGRRSGERTLFQEAVGRVDEVVRLMRPSDTLSVVLAGHTPEAVNETPAAGTGVAEVRERLRHMRPGTTDASITDAILAAREQLNRGSNLRKVILVLSDQQRSNWAADNESAWRAALGDRSGGVDRDVQVFAMPLAARTVSPNASVSALTIGPGVVGVGRVVQISATLSNAGPGELPATPLRLIVDGQTAGPMVQAGALAEGQSQTVRFEHVFDKAGSHWVAVQAEVVDSLEADNRMVASVNVLDTLPVLIVDGEVTDVGGHRAAAFLQAAMNPAEEGMMVAGEGLLIAPRVVSLSAALRTPLEPYGVVVFNDVPTLPAEYVGRVAEAVQAGKGAWFILGPRTEAAFVNDVLRKTALFQGRVRGVERAARGGVAGVDVRDPDHPALALVAGAGRNALVGVAVTQWWEVAEAGDAARVLLATAGEEGEGDPLALAFGVGQNGGRVVVWTTSADGQWSNLPLATNFVPLVNETLFYLAAGRNTAEDRRLEAGERLVWTAASDPPIAGVDVVRPDGGTQRVQAVLTGGKYVVAYDSTHVPGLYEVRPVGSDASRGGPGVAHFSVNIDRRELEPAVLSATDMQWLVGQKYVNEAIGEADLARALGAANRGTEVWPYAALAVFVLLLVETVMTRRMVRLQAGESAAAVVREGHA